MGLPTVQADQPPWFAIVHRRGGTWSFVAPGERVRPTVSSRRFAHILAGLERRASFSNRICRPDGFHRSGYVVDVDLCSRLDARGARSRRRGLCLRRKTTAPLGVPCSPRHRTCLASFETFGFAIRPAPEVGRLRPRLSSSPRQLASCGDRRPRRSGDQNVIEQTERSARTSFARPPNYLNGEFSGLPLNRAA